MEQIKLEGLGRFARDALAKHHDPIRPLPLLDSELEREGADPIVDPHPALARRDATARPEPLPQGHPHGELHPRGRQKVENGLLAELAVEPDLDGNGSQPLPNIIDQKLQTIPCTLGVVDIARSVDDVEHLTGLGQVCGQRVVGWILRMVRVEPTRRILGTLAGADDRPIQVERDPAKLRARPGREGDIAKHLTEALSIRARHRLQPTRERPYGRQAAESREAQEDRIRLQLSQVNQPSAADQQQPDHAQCHPEGSVVAVEVPVREDLPKAPSPARTLEEAGDEREPRMCTHRLVGEDDRKMALDAGPQKSFPQSHWNGLVCLGLKDSATTSFHSTKAISTSEAHFF